MRSLIKEKKNLPFSPTKEGRQWGKIPDTKEVYEIDMLAINKKTKENSLIYVNMIIKIKI